MSSMSLAAHTVHLRVGSHHSPPTDSTQLQTLDGASGPAISSSVFTPQGKTQSRRQFTRLHVDLFLHRSWIYDSVTSFGVCLFFYIILRPTVWGVMCKVVWLNSSVFELESVISKRQPHSDQMYKTEMLIIFRYFDLWSLLNVRFVQL